MKQSTPEWREIMRLWGVIQKLTQWKGFRMNEREEALFGAVYQEFSKTRTPAAVAATYDEEALMAGGAAALRAELTTVAARTLRVLYDMENR